MRGKREIYQNGERRLHNKEFLSPFRTSNTVRMGKFRRVRWAGHLARREESRSVFKILTGKRTESSRLRHRWEGNISIDLKERRQYEELNTLG